MTVFLSCVCGGLLVVGVVAVMAGLSAKTEKTGEHSREQTSEKITAFKYHTGGGTYRMGR